MSDLELKMRAAADRHRAGDLLAAEADATLATLRIQRTERVVVQSFTVAPYLLQGTDLMFTTTRHFANFYLPLLPLAVLRAPIAFPRMRFYQLWHDRNHHSASHRWLRRLVQEAARCFSAA